jgi:hypothetical protein
VFSCDFSALYGMQNMNTKGPRSPVREMLAILAEKIKDCPSNFHSKAISNCLYGLQKVITALKRKVDESDDEFKGVDVELALHGLQLMSSGDIAVPGLIASLARKINESKSILTPKDVDNALAGLARMNSNKTEIRALLAALTKKGLRD